MQLDDLPEDCLGEILRRVPRRSGLWLNRKWGRVLTKLNYQTQSITLIAEQLRQTVPYHRFEVIAPFQLAEWAVQPQTRDLVLHNQGETEEIETADFSTWRALEDLTVDQVKLTGLPNSLRQLLVDEIDVTVVVQAGQLHHFDFGHLTGDPQALSQLTHLVQLGGKEVETDWLFLAGLPQLQRLQCDDPTYRFSPAEFHVMSQLPSLREVDFRFFVSPDQPGLFPQITHFCAYEYRGSLLPLRSCINLISLTISLLDHRVSLEELTGLHELSQLRRLNVARLVWPNKVALLTQLTDLSLDCSSFRSHEYARLANLTHLEALKLTSRRMRQPDCLKYLAHFTRLRTLVLDSGFNLIDVKPFTQLTSLTLQSSRAGGSDLVGLTNLTHLTVPYCALPAAGLHFHYLTQLPRLEYLMITQVLREEADVLPSLLDYQRLKQQVASFHLMFNS